MKKCIYNQQKQLYNDSLKQLERHTKANELLMKNGWFFVAPLFFQGFELERIYQLSLGEQSCKEEIDRIIYRKFYNLEWTASFIEGYCKQSDFIRPFLLSIENSLILAFQKDYEGAIKTLTPVIEGVLRRYLEKRENLTGNIGFREIERSLSKIKKDACLDYERGLRDYRNHNGDRVEFDENQIKNLVRLRRKSDDIWFSFLADFFERSFYKNTHGEPLKDEINRHSILHALNPSYQYTLQGYIKVYFVLNFLTWAFIQLERKSGLSAIRGFRFLEKTLAYHSIIKHSEEISFSKHLLLKEYEGYVPALIQKRARPTGVKLLPWTKLLKYRFMIYLQKSIWKKGFPV